MRCRQHPAFLKPPIPMVDAAESDRLGRVAVKLGARLRCADPHGVGAEEVVEAASRALDKAEKLFSR